MIGTEAASDLVVISPKGLHPKVLGLRPLIRGMKGGRRPSSMGISTPSAGEILVPGASNADTEVEQ